VAYTVDLTAVLKSLFENTITRTQMSQLSENTWSELKKAFDGYQAGGPLERIHHHFYDIFQHDQQILDSEDSFRGMFDKLLKDERQGTGVPILVSVPVSRFFTSVFSPIKPRTRVRI
jgi:hypothetical protein